MNQVLLSGAVLMAFLGLTQQVEAAPGSAFVLRSMPGFALGNPAYRAGGDGMSVEVRVCRISGWAAATPGRLHVQREGGDGVEPGHRDVALRQLGLRSGENCERVVTRFVGAPRPQEHITICLAYSHKRCE